MKVDFSEIADRYDDFYIDPVGNLIDELEKKAVDRILPASESGQTLVEAGSGTGHWSRYFASKGYVVTGVELCREMRNIAIGKKIPGAKFVLGAAESILLDDDTFDFGAAIALLEFVQNPSRIVSELARVVKSSGRLIFGVMNEDSMLGRLRKTNPHPIYTPAHFFRETELNKLLSSFGNVNIHHCLFRFPTPDTLTETIAEEKEAIAEGRRDGCFMVAEVILK